MCDRCCCVVCISTSEVGVIETCGKYSRLASPGANFVCCCLGDCVSGRLSMRVQQLDVSCETKTLDNVFVTANVSVQYLVVPELAYEAFYRLTSPRAQIEAHVFDVIRTTIPTMALDRAFESKDEVARALQDELAGVMAAYGFRIHQALVTDLSPDEKVRDAMNEITAQRNYKNAAYERAEGEKVLLVKNAEAAADAKYLSGVGTARQRKAIVGSMRDSITTFRENVGGASDKDVVELLLLTQYFDTLREIGAQPQATTAFLPSARAPAGASMSGRASRALYGSGPSWGASLFASRGTLRLRAAPVAAEAAGGPTSGVTTFSRSVSQSFPMMTTLACPDSSGDPSTSFVCGNYDDVVTDDAAVEVAATEVAATEVEVDIDVEQRAGAATADVGAQVGALTEAREPAQTGVVVADEAVISASAATPAPSGGGSTDPKDEKYQFRV